MRGRMLQRASSLLLAIVMVLTMIPVVSAQTEETQSEVGSIIIDGYNPVPGETITVNVRLENNPGIASMRIELIYDNAVFTLTGLEYNSAMGGQTNPPEDLSNYQSPFVLYWNNGGLSTDYTEDGVFATLTFLVSEEVAKGRSYTITAVYDPDEIYNGQDENVTFEVTEGKFVVYDCVAGDIDGNGKVNMRDLTVLQRYYSGWNDQVVNTPVMDVNGDGKTNSRDVTTLQRHFAGWEVTLNCTCTLTTCVHNLTSVPAKEATCTEEGNIAYWYCAACGKYFSNAEATTEITYAETKVALADHTVEKVEKTEPTCTETGNIEHWKCTVCGALFADAEAKTEITDSDTELALADHTLNKVEAKEPTIDEAGNREYWKCGVCGKCFSDAEAKNQVTEDSMIELAVPSYTITFVDKYNWPTGNTVKFAQSEPLLLTKEAYPAPAVEGYEFQGWYTSSTGGEIVDSIPAGNTGNKMLFAQWEKITYTITYNKAPVHNNTLTYTIEDEVTLTDPEWSGLKFTGWDEPTDRLEIYENQAGETAARIPKGTIGNMEITATWTTFENLVNPKENGKLASVYDPDTGKYYFLYDLGMIENVPLDQIFETYEKTTTGNYTMSISETVTVETSKAQSIAQTMSNSVTQTEQWQDTIGSLNEGTVGVDFKLSLGMDFGIDELWTAKFNTEFGVSSSFTAQSTHETTVGTVVDESTGLEKEYSSTINYAETLSTTSETSMEIPGSMPNGTYAFVHAGDIRVFAAITYDPVDDWYYMNTYSVLDNMHTIMLYYANKETMYDSPCGGLTAEVPVTKIKAIVESGYYVQYNADGGEGTMPVSIFLTGESGTLTENKFTKLGYTFDGWELTKSDLTKVVYQDNDQICDLAAGGETVELVAQWKPNTYTVTYEGNGANGGSTASSEHTYDEEKTLTANGFVRQYTVTYYCNGGTVSSSTATAKYSFNGWLGEDGKPYTDKAAVLNLKSEDGATVKMTAQWTPASVTLPLPTRTGYDFLGWYADQNLTEPKIGMNGGMYEPTQDIPLYAKWTPASYTVNFDSNGGSSVDPFEATYTNTYVAGYGGPLPKPTRDDYAFVCWTLNGEEITDSTTVNIAGEHTLVAQWTPTKGTWSKYSRDEEVPNGGYKEYCNVGLDYAALKRCGYTKLAITLYLEGDDTNSWYNDDPYVEFYNRDGSFAGSIEMDSWPHDWGTATYTIELGIDVLRDDKTIGFLYNNHGKDVWYLGTTVVTVVAK